jgi:hypothetical protein
MNKRFDQKLPVKSLYANLRSEGVLKDKTEETTDSPNLDDLNKHFTNVAKNISLPKDTNYIRHPNLPTECQFHFRCVSQLEVFEAYNRIFSNAVGSDGLGRKFLRHVIPFILPVISASCLRNFHHPGNWLSFTLYLKFRIQNPCQNSDPSVCFHSFQKSLKF